MSSPPRTPPKSNSFFSIREKWDKRDTAATSVAASEPAAAFPFSPQKSKKKKKKKGLPSTPGLCDGTKSPVGRSKSFGQAYSPSSPIRRAKSFGEVQSVGSVPKAPAFARCVSLPCSNKSVRFSDKNQIRDIETIEELSESLILNLWWSEGDYIEMRQGWETVLYFLESGKPVCEDTLSARGLHKRTDAGAWELYEIQRDARNAVFEVQERQRKAKRTDPYEISLAYLQHTAKSQVEALEQGAVDAKSVDKFKRKKSKKYSSQSPKKAASSKKRQKSSSKKTTEKSPTPRPFVLKDSFLLKDPALSPATSPKPKRKKIMSLEPSRKVQFNDELTFLKAKKVKDMEKAIKRRWISEKELQSITKGFKSTVKLMEKGEEVDETEEQTARGLEHSTKEGQKKLVERRQKVLSIVLKAQEKGKALDAEALAEASRNVTADDTRRAVKQGRSDARDAKRNRVRRRSIQGCLSHKLNNEASKEVGVGATPSVVSTEESSVEPEFVRLAKKRRARRASISETRSFRQKNRSMDPFSMIAESIAKVQMDDEAEQAAKSASPAKKERMPTPPEISTMAPFSMIGDAILGVKPADEVENPVTERTPTPPQDRWCRNECASKSPKAQKALIGCTSPKTCGNTPLPVSQEKQKTEEAPPQDRWFRNGAAPKSPKSQKKSSVSAPPEQFAKVSSPSSEGTQKKQNPPPPDRWCRNGAAPRLPKAQTKLVSVTLPKESDKRLSTSSHEKANNDDLPRAKTPPRIVAIIDHPKAAEQTVTDPKTMVRISSTFNSVKFLTSSKAEKSLPDTPVSDVTPSLRRIGDETPPRCSDDSPDDVPKAAPATRSEEKGALTKPKDLANEPAQQQLPASTYVEVEAGAEQHNPGASQQPELPRVDKDSDSCIAAAKLASDLVSQKQSNFEKNQTTENDIGEAHTAALSALPSEIIAQADKAIDESDAESVCTRTSVTALASKFNIPRTLSSDSKVSSCSSASRVRASEALVRNVSGTCSVGSYLESISRASNSSDSKSEAPPIPKRICRLPPSAVGGSTRSCPEPSASARKEAIACSSDLPSLEESVPGSSTENTCEVVATRASQNSSGAESSCEKEAEQSAPHCCPTDHETEMGSQLHDCTAPGVDCAVLDTIPPTSDCALLIGGHANNSATSGLQSAHMVASGTTSKMEASDETKTEDNLSNEVKKQPCWLCTSDMGVDCVVGAQEDEKQTCNGKEDAAQIGNVNTEESCSGKRGAPPLAAAQTETSGTSETEAVVTLLPPQPSDAMQENRQVQQRGENGDFTISPQSRPRVDELQFQSSEETQESVGATANDSTGEPLDLIRLQAAPMRTDPKLQSAKATHDGQAPSTTKQTIKEPATPVCVEAGQSLETAESTVWLQVRQSDLVQIPSTDGKIMYLVLACQHRQVLSPTGLSEN